MKSSSGISLIELVVVMIIMIMIAVFTVFNGSDSVEKAEATELYTEMTTIRNAVAGVLVQKDLENGDDSWLEGYYDREVGNNWYEIYGMEEEEKYLSSDSMNVRKNLNVDNIKRNYLVNYETGEVELSKSIKVFGNSVKTYDSVRALVESNKI